MTSTIERSHSTKEKVVVTPSAAFESIQSRLTVDPNIVDELLLVCGVIGTTTRTEGDTRIVPVTDCLQWIQDLQRCLRRDDDIYRPISILLKSWNIVASKLIPLVLCSQYDTAMLTTLCKVFVILTKPLHAQTIRTGRMILNPKKVSQSVLQEQNKLRENALQQAAILMEYKRLFCPVAPRSETAPGLFSIFVGLLAEPFSRVGSARTDADHLTIELILYLFRNLLLAEPLGSSLSGSIQRSNAAQDLHFELVTCLGQELVLEIVYVVCADIEQRENHSYNLLLMEFIQLLFKHHDPVQTAQFGRQDRPRPLTTDASSSSSSLRKAMQREKQALQVHSTSRHSHFGGTFLLEKENGQKQVLSAAFFGRTDLHPQSHATITLRRSKHSEPFIGANAPSQADPRGASNLFSFWQKQSTRTVHQFCSRFLVESKCYGPLMKSLKNEFRRDTVRLEDNDRIIYFQMITFLSRWWRTTREETSVTASPISTEASNAESADALPSSGTIATSSIGQLIFTMDVFSFNLVFNAIDTFMEHKKYGNLAHSVSLLREMMHLLKFMQSSASDDTNSSSTEHMMAMGLMDRLFYGSEPLDRLPKLLARWTPGTSTREYVSDLVDITHSTMELLDRNRSRSAHLDKDTPQDTVEKMNAAASEFDVDSYFARRIVSNHTVTMYTHLLSHYATNGPAVNQQILAFFERLCQFTLSYGSNDPKTRDFEDLDIENPLAAQTVTLEPMLYNVSFFLVLHTILQDRSLRTDPEARPLLEFATRRVQTFAKAAHSNPVLYVEALFSHPFPHRFCDLIANVYVTEDLRMFVERDLLLKQQYQLEQQAEALSSDSSDDELEFTDAPASTRLAAATRSKASSSYQTRHGEDTNEESDVDIEEREFNDTPALSGLPPVSREDDENDADVEDAAELEFNETPTSNMATSPSRSALHAQSDGEASDVEFNNVPQSQVTAHASPSSRAKSDDEDSDVPRPLAKKARIRWIDSSDDEATEGLVDEN